MNTLSSSDRAILNSMFNPLLPLGEAVVDDVDITSNQATEDQTEGCSTPEGRALNKEAVKAAEQGRTEDALKAFDRVIRDFPAWASPYNNRAQLLRMLRREEEAMSDLEKALELSNSSGTVGCQALVQKGLLHRLAHEDQKARESFKMAADLGSSFAKTQLVALNPMAALCNKMLVKMVTDVKEGRETT